MAVKESGQSVALSHAVKLFGMKISLSVTPADEDQATPRTELAKSEVLSQNGEEIGSLSASTSGSSDDDKASKREDEDHSGQGDELPRRHEEQEDKKSGRPLKRPDKPVSCPRCHSLDTKFCYFNNYNINQPRHFCKNCQRYWTAGGTLRNVPVGAGRRKNKNGRVEQGTGGKGDLESPDGKLAAGKFQQQREQPSCKVSRASDAGTDGSFGFIRSFASRSSPPIQQKAQRPPPSPQQPPPSPQQPPLSPQQPQPPKQKQPQHSVSVTSEGSNDSRDDSTCGSSVSNPVRECKDGSSTTNWPCALFSGSGPWSFPGWNAWSSSPWGNIAANAATAAAKALAQNVHTALGKHLRDEKPVVPEAGPARKRPEGSLWAPKTLRIDARGDGNRGSSFLADIATGSHKVDTISTGGMFKAFQQESRGAKLDDRSETGDDINKED